MTSLIVAMLLAGTAPPAEPAAVAAATATIRAVPDLAAAQAEARKGSRPILASFHTSWCVWCKKLDRETFRDPRLVARSEKDLVFVRIDAEDGGSGSALAKKYKVRSFPTLIVLDAGGRQLARMNGFRTADELLGALAEVDRDQAALQAILDREEKAADDPQVLFDVAQALARADRGGEAAERYQAILALKGERARQFEDLALWNHAEIVAAAGDPKRAITDLERLVKEFPATSRAESAQLRIGRLRHEIGDRDGAIAAYQRFVEIFPNSRYTATLRRELERMKGRERGSNR